MGEVYRARDTRLRRDVAVKVLPDALSHEPDRLARFQHEARILATLNHPNIAAVYGLEHAAPTDAIIMELVEGQTLAEHLLRRATVADAMRIALQLADALDAAHEKGIIHRDLKPANIKITPEGVVKVLDFGLAKAVTESATGEQASGLAPTTMTLGGTLEGTVLGTPAYMSPEQARGQAVDRRTDVWAFGCVLYEILAGRPAFKGRTTTDTLAAVVGQEPDWSALPAGVPATVQRLLRRCLDKDVKRRLRDIGDARIDIEEAGAGGVRSEASSANERRTSRRLGWLAAGVAVAVAATAAAWVLLAGMNRPAAASPGEMRLEVTTPWTRDPGSIAVSPDGTAVVFAATSGDQTGLWLRELNSGVVRFVPETEGAIFPFWSPDGRSLGFFADGKLKRLALAGGTAETLADAISPHGGTWAADGTIFFTPAQIFPIHRVAAEGVSSPVTKLEPMHVGHLHPQFLPDGAHVLYFAWGPAEVRGVYVARTDGSVVRRLLQTDTPARFEPTTGRLLFARDGNLFAQPVDLGRLELTGSPIRVADDIAAQTGGAGWIGVSTSTAGPVVYRARAASGDHQLVWYDRSGSELTRLTAPSAANAGASVSPDGRQLALSRAVDGNRNIWLLDLSRGALSRFTSTAGSQGAPLWLPDGSRLVFSSTITGHLAMHSRSVLGGAEEPLLVTPQNTNPADLSPDGRVLLYLRADPKTHLDIWGLPLGSPEATFPIVQSSSEDLNPQFAPNGAWLAYQTNESGQHEVSIRPYRRAGRAIQVSLDGGTQPRWRRDGRELFFLDLAGRLMAVPIVLPPDGQSVDVGVPSPLFQTRIGGAGIAQKEYLVAPDGQRFLLDTATSDTSPPIKVMLNWRP